MAIIAFSLCFSIFLLLRELKCRVQTKLQVCHWVSEHERDAQEIWWQWTYKFGFLGCCKLRANEYEIERNICFRETLKKFIRKTTSSKLARFPSLTLFSCPAERNAFWFGATIINANETSHNGRACHYQFLFSSTCASESRWICITGMSTRN